MGITLDTLGALIDHDHGLGVHCLNPDCRRYVELDLEALALRLGRNQRSLASDLAPKLFCSECGSKNIAFTVLAPTPGSPRFRSRGEK